MGLWSKLFGGSSTNVSKRDLPGSIEVMYKELNNLTYPLMFHVCSSRKLDTTDVPSLFQAQCPGCNSIMNTVALMQIGDILETGAITPTPLQLKCPQCGVAYLTEDVVMTTVRAAEEILEEK